MAIFDTGRRGRYHSAGWKWTSMASASRPSRMALRNGRPANSFTFTSPSPSSGEITTTSSPRARIASTRTAAYAPIPQWRGG